MIARDVVQALLALLLIVLALGLGAAALLRVRRPARRCDDPAADPDAEPYGEQPGFSAAKLMEFPAPMSRAERDAQRRRFVGGDCGVAPRVTRAVVDAAADGALACICHEHKPDCDCADGRAALTPAENLSFVSALAVEAAEDFLRVRDQARLAGKVAKLLFAIKTLPRVACRLPLAAPVELLAKTLACTAVADAADLVRWASIATELAQLVRKGNAAQREALAGEARTSLDKGEELDALAKLPEERRAALIDRAAAGERVSAKIEAKRHVRDTREKVTAGIILALPQRRFGVAIEDFEWDYAEWNPDTGSARSPSMHYETAEGAHTPEAIVARCAERFAMLADDCILFKWTTIPHLAIALKVLELQGFTYKTHLVWDKQRAGRARGQGRWFTGEHELVLVGTRGHVVPPATAHFRSRFEAPVGAHSEKPPQIHEIVEFHWPHTPKIELNARTVRPGWAAWSNEVGFVEAGAGRSIIEGELT